MEPRLIVELGTHYGESYFGFCQAVAESSLSCACYAVDTWVGEPHAGFYTEEVYNEVNQYNATYYSAFSYLLRTTFDEALAQFEDESIDILHVDGLHTYEAVSHDVFSWMKKVRPGGVVLMHDIMCRHADFGVWRLWEELDQHGERFAFTHSWGLGVWLRPGIAPRRGSMLDVMLHSPKKKQQHVRRFYELCASKLSLEHLEASPAKEAAPPTPLTVSTVVQIYPYNHLGYSGETAFQESVRVGDWQKVSVILPTGLGDGPPRIDPADRPGIIDLSHIQIKREADKAVLWEATGASGMAGLHTAGDLRPLNGLTADDNGFLRFVSLGCDPQILLPDLRDIVTEPGLIVELRIRVHDDALLFLRLLASASEERSAHANRPEVQHEELKLRVSQQETELLKKRTEAAELGAQVVEQQTLLNRERELANAALQKLKTDTYLLKTDLRTAQAERDSLRQELMDVRPRLGEAEKTIQGVLASKSWRITAPLRRLFERVR